MLLLLNENVVITLNETTPFMINKEKNDDDIIEYVIHIEEDKPLLEEYFGFEENKLLITKEDYYKILEKLRKNFTIFTTTFKDNEYNLNGHQSINIDFIKAIFDEEGINTGSLLNYNKTVKICSHFLPEDLLNTFNTQAKLKSF